MRNISILQLILVIIIAMLIFTDLSKVKRKILNFLKNKRKGI